jgi:hypothetical protein
MSQETRPTTAAIARAIQNQTHGNPELLVVVAVGLGVGDAAGGAITMVVWVGCALAAGLLATGVVGALVVGGADVAGAVVSAGADVAGADVAGADVATAGVEAPGVRPAVTLAAMLLAADEMLLAAPHPASSPVMMTIRPANPAPCFRTLNPSRARLRCPHQAECADGAAGSATRGG